MAFRTALVVFTLAIITSVSSWKNEVKLTKPSVVPVGERARGQLNLFRQPLEFALDIAIGFDIAKFGSGHLSHLPILTLLVGIAGFFLLVGIMGTPFAYLADLKKKRFRRESGSETSFFGKWRGFDVEDGFSYIGLTNETEDFACRKYVLCELHRYFQILPMWALKGLQFFGKRFKNMGMYKDAVNAGLELEDCPGSFPSCPKNLLQIVSSLPFKLMRRT